MFVLELEYVKVTHRFPSGVIYLLSALTVLLYARGDYISGDL